MTECPKCKGYGIVGSAVPDILRGRGAIFSSNECDMCNGSGEVEMTNEEWFCTLPTEEKARWIAKQKCDGCNDEPYDDKHGTCNYCMAKKTEQIREWLKQPHTEKE